MSDVKVGDTIKCSDKDEMVATSIELAKSDILTDFVYEKDGEKGYWLEVTTISGYIPTVEEVKEKICDDYCYYAITGSVVLEKHCEDCPLKYLED